MSYLISAFFALNCPLSILSNLSSNALFVKAHITKITENLDRSIQLF